MSADSLRLLAATWAWCDAVLGVLTLGVLAPLTVAVLLATLLLGVQRRDWRLVPGAIGALALITGGGIAVVLLVQPPAPAHDYLFGLSATLGALVTGFACVGVIRLGVRRRRRDRLAAAAVELEADVPAAAVVPAPGPHRWVNAVSAEHLVAEWMQHLGATESHVTPFDRDGGVDVRSERYVAQVKNRSDLVPVDQVRALAGVAVVERRQPLFFTSGAYSRDSIAFASEAGVALFIFRVQEARLIGANRLGAELRRNGLRGPTARPLAASATDERPAVSVLR